MFLLGKPLPPGPTFVGRSKCTQTKGLALKTCQGQTNTLAYSFGASVTKRKSLTPGWHRCQGTWRPWQKVSAGPFPGFENCLKLKLKLAKSRIFNVAMLKTRYY